MPIYFGMPILLLSSPLNPDFDIPNYFDMPKVFSDVDLGHWFGQPTHSGMPRQRLVRSTEPIQSVENLEVSTDLWSVDDPFRSTIQT